MQSIKLFKAVQISLRVFFLENIFYPQLPQKKIKMRVLFVDNYTLRLQIFFLVSYREEKMLQKMTACSN